MKKLLNNKCPNCFRAFHIFGTLILALLYSCTKPEFTRSLQPESDDLMLGSTFEVVPVCITERVDSLASSQVLQNCAGAYIDPILGKVNASFAAQLRLQLNNISFGTNPIVDSIILALPYAGAYGDVLKLNGLQRFVVYELDSALNTQQVYYTNKNFPVKPEPIGVSPYLVPRLNTNVPVAGTSSFPQLRIRLNQSLGERFVDPENQSNFQNTDVFLNFFKGIKVEAELFREQAGDGSIVYFDLLRGARIELYYKNDTQDSLRANFVINELSSRVNTFSHQYSPEVLNALNNPEAGKQRLFNQSTAGLRTVMHFPDLQQWKAGRRILVNKAELEVYADENTIGIYSPPLRIDAVTRDAEGRLLNLPDFAIRQVRPLGGDFLVNQKLYRFTVTKYIQELLDGAEDRGLILVNTAAVISANRVVFHGPESATNPLRLKIIYKEL